MSISDTAPQTAADLLRAHMPVAANYAYFDHAAVAPLPSQAAAALAAYAEEAQAGGDVKWLEWAAKLEQLRGLAARMLGAGIEELALVPNTSFGINLVAEGFPWKTGDNVVLPSNEFPSNMLPWQNLEQRGVEVRIAEVPEDERIGPDLLAPLIDRRTRLIALSWVGFASGFRVDVAKIVDLAHQHGVLVMLDAIQGLGAFPLDLHSSGVDFLSADGHKWMLGPEGAGLFFAKAEHLNLLRPIGLGWNSLAAGGFEPGARDLKQTASRYEGGTMNMPGFHGLLASLSLLDQAGLNAGRPAAQIIDNVSLLQDKLSAHDFQVILPERSEERSGIIGVNWSGAKQDPQQFSKARKFLIKNGVVTSVRAGRLRISTHAYNNENDMDQLVSALVDFRRLHS